MPPKQTALSPYEQKVDQLVRQFVATKPDHIMFFAGNSGVTGNYWELDPRNPHAAKAHIYAVGKKGISLTVENFYYVDIPAPLSNWDEALLTLSAYLQAILDGRVLGWYVAEDGLVKYVLEFTFGEEADPVDFTSHVTFAGQFKDRDDVSHIMYEPY